MLIDTATAKLHLRVDDDSEDSLIALYVGAAQASASEWLGRAIYADVTEQGTDTAGVIVNDAIRAAMLLHVGTLFANRESVVLNARQAFELPMGVKHLLQPYRVEGI